MLFVFIFSYIFISTYELCALFLTHSLSLASLFSFFLLSPFLSLFLSCLFLTQFYLYGVSLCLCPCVSVSCSLCLSETEDLVKPGSDAGMPGIEDSEVGKVDEMQFGEY